MDRFAQVDYLSRLIRVGLTDEERDLFSLQLAHILDYVEQLRQVDITDVEPMFYPVPIENRFREDVVGQSLDRENALANAPKKTDTGFFVVPPVLE